MTFPAPSATYHTACGSPPVEGSDALPPGSVCATCGFPAVRGMPMRKWSGAESLILDKLTAPGSPYACEACVFACAWIAPPGRTAKEGQSRGPAPSQYSHLIVTDNAGKVVRYANASKGEKPVILGWLRERFAGPWWLVIADMGKKQLIPWAQWNLSTTGAGATVHLDDEAVSVGDLALPGAMAEMLTLGATKASMERGDYASGEWARCGEALRAFERTYGHWRGSGWWRMSLWLAQRDEDAVAERMAEEKATREAKKTAEKEAQKAAKAKPAKTPAPKKPKASKPTTPATPTDPVRESAHGQPEAQAQQAHGNGPRTAAHDDGGTTARPLPTSPASQMEPARPVGPDQQPSARKRKHQADPGDVGQRDAGVAQTGRPEQAQLGLFG